MIELEKIGLKNIITHKNTNFSFVDGITCVRGENASGKSLLFSVIPNVFDGCPPLAKKKDSKVLHSENSGIGILYKNNDVEYKVKQVSENGNLTYSILKNGEDITPRTIPLAKDLLKNIFPLSTEQYYSLVHLTPYRPHILLSGSGTQRKEFFENLFRLNQTEEKAEKLKAKLNELKRLKDEKQILTEQLDEMLKDSKEDVISIEELEENIKILQARKNRKTEEYQTLVKSSNVISSYNIYKEQLCNKNLLNEKMWESILSGSNRDLEKMKEQYETKLREMQTQKIEYEKFKKAEKEIKDAENEIQSIGDCQFNREELEKQKSDIIINGKTLSEQLERLKTENEQQIANAVKHNETIDRFLTISASLPEKLKGISADDFKERVIRAKQNVSRNEQLIEKLTKLQDVKNCPTCLRILNKDEIETVIKNCESEIQSSNRILKYETNGLLFFTLSEQVGDCNKVDVDVLRNKNFKKISETETQIKDLRAKVSAINADIEKSKRIESLKTKISTLQTSFKRQTEPEQGLFEKTQDCLKTVLTQIQTNNADFNTLKKIEQLGEIPKVPDNFEELMTSLSNELEQINDDMQGIQVKIELGKKQNEQVLKRRNRIEQINEDLKDFKVYEALVKAYGAKGIRVAQIKALANLYCANLNKFKNLVFNKEIKFQVTVDSTNFNIIAERNGNPSADVITLSGQESRCFMLLSLISLLPFIPPSIRTNFVILDEIEAGISEDNRKLISKDFLPALKNLIPRIVVVTPMKRQEFYIESDREFFLTLKNNETNFEVVK